jgi:hypothetical protein
MASGKDQEAAVEAGGRNRGWERGLLEVFFSFLAQEARGGSGIVTSSCIRQRSMLDKRHRVSPRSSR